LHAGSLVAALASWLDAKAHGGQWLVRIEDVDTPRTVAGADQHILQQLATCGLHPNAPPTWQSTRTAHYEAALTQLQHAGLAYACTCSRKDIETTLALQGHTRTRHAELVYPGNCRVHVQHPMARAQAWRLRTDRPGATHVAWHDRWLGAQAQNVSQSVGDFVLRRADGCWTYQLAVVVDDAAQGVTHVVRGADLADNTARQIWLQQCLGLPTPQYLHTPLVMGADGHKLSKQNGAQALDLSEPLQALNAAAAALGWPAQTGTVAQALATWTAMAAQAASPVARQSAPST